MAKQLAHECLAKTHYLIIALGFWIEVSLSAAWADQRYSFELHPEHILVSVALFIFAYAFSHWLHARESVKAKDYGVLLSLWTLRFGLITLLVLSYEGPWREIIAADWDHLASMWQMVAVLLGASLWLAWKTAKLQTLLPIAAFCALSMIAVVLSGNSAHAVYFQIIYNIALVGSGIWLILRGIHSGISHYFFLGIAAILLTALMRYIDLIGEYVGGAILFMMMAALLLGAAKYWKAQQTREAGS